MERSADLLLYRLHRLASVAGQPLIRLCEGEYGITRREWRLIVVLAQEGPLLSSELARRASLVPARTSRAVTVMVESGLAHRVPRPSDRRFVEIHLTERARQIYTTLYPIVEDLNAQLIDGLSAAERAEVGRLFGILERAAATLTNRVPLPKANRQRLRSTSAGEKGAA